MNKLKLKPKPKSKLESKPKTKPTSELFLLMLTPILISLISVSSFGAEFAILANQDSIQTADLAPPEQTNTIALQADYKISSDYMKNRTENQCVYGKIAAKMDLEVVFAKPLGPLEKSEIEPFVKILHLAMSDAVMISRSVKEKFERERPFVKYSHEITPCAMASKTTSFPSSHATLSRMVAQLFSEIYPERARLLLEVSDQIALSRVIAGVHFQSDVEAGKKLGDRVFEALKNQTDFYQCLKTQTGCEKFIIEKPPVAGF